MESGTHTGGVINPLEVRMNWFPVFTAVAIVVVTFFGIDNPNRAITLQLSLAFVAAVVLAYGWWKESRTQAEELHPEVETAA